MNDSCPPLVPLLTVVPAIKGCAHRDVSPAGLEMLSVGSVCVNKNNPATEATIIEMLSIPRIPRLEILLMFVFIFFTSFLLFSKSYLTTQYSEP